VNLRFVVRIFNGEGSYNITVVASYSFEADVVCSVSVIPLQHRSCSVCMSFVRLGYHNGQTLAPR